MIGVNKKTKIIATIGPACSSEEMLLELVKEGVDMFRLNFSHGSHEDHLPVINRIHAINDKYDTHVGIIADLSGPKIRIGKVAGKGIMLKKDDVLYFTNVEQISKDDTIFINYKSFAKDIKLGERVLLDDGKLVLEILETNNKDCVKLKVLFGGLLTSNKGVNLPDTNVTLPALSTKDLNDLDFILTQKVNWIALSFVRHADDVIALKKIISDNNHNAKVISKIEKPEAVRRIKSIIKASDAIMIARGDLGVEVPIEKLPVIQKQIIKKSLEYGKPAIVATQMMESMITNHAPSRSEVTDVANAVIDGTDAVMLSGETSVGNHPGRVVKAMTSVIQEVESSYHPKGKILKPDQKSSSYLSDMICYTAAKTADEIKAKAIVGMTAKGYTAFKISSFRPKMNVIIFSEDRSLLNTLNLVWGVKCFFYDKVNTTDETMHDVNVIIKDKKLVKTGDRVINTGSMPLYKKLKTNMLKISIIE